MAYSLVEEKDLKQVPHYRVINAVEGKHVSQERHTQLSEIREAFSREEMGIN